MTSFNTKQIDRYVGARLKERRILMGLSQNDLAKKHGITFQQIQKYEGGVNRIGAGRLYEFAKYLEVEINYFYNGFEEDYEMKKTSKISLAAMSAFDKIQDEKIKKAVKDFILAMSDSK